MTRRGGIHSGFTWSISPTMGGQPFERYLTTHARTLSAGVDVVGGSSRGLGTAALADLFHRTHADWFEAARGRHRAGLCGAPDSGSGRPRHGRDRCVQTFLAGRLASAEPSLEAPFGRGRPAVRAPEVGRPCGSLRGMRAPDRSPAGAPLQPVWRVCGGWLKGPRVWGRRPHRRTPRGPRVPMIAPVSTRGIEATRRRRVRRSPRGERPPRPRTAGGSRRRAWAPPVGGRSPRGPVPLVSSCASPTLSGARHLEESEPIIEDRTGSIKTLLYACHLQLQDRAAPLACTAFIGDTPDLHPRALTRAILATDRDRLAL